MPTHSGIKDNGTHFQIVPNTRKVAVPQSHKTLGTLGDHLSEQVTFICPKLIDGHDIKGCSEHYVSWETPSGEPGHDHLELISEDSKNLLYAWNIRGNATMEAGIVSFSVHFADISKSGKTLYHWGTTDCKECEILTAVNHAIGAYERIYVDGNKLVIADFNLVKDRKLLLQTPGVVPSGNKFIDTNGHHDVAGLASVDVAVPTEREPTLEVYENGLIKAHDGTAVNVKTEQLSEAHDPDFIPQNIRHGKTVFGVSGVYGTDPVTVSVTNNTADGLTNGDAMMLAFHTMDENGIIASESIQPLQRGETHTTTVVPGSIITILVPANVNLKCLLGDEEKPISLFAGVTFGKNYALTVGWLGEEKYSLVMS